MQRPDTSSTSPGYPDTLADILPSDVLELPRWVVWKLVTRPGEKKPTKVPFNSRTGRGADSTKASTWSTYGEACAAFKRAKGRYSGVGFVLGDEIVGVDLDHCRDAETGELEPWALAIVQAMNSYAEVSPSGTGVHILVRGVLPPGGRHGKHVELYERDRFFTVTGAQLPETPRELHERSDALAALHAQTFPQEAPPPPEHTPQNIPKDMPMDDVAVIERAMRARNGADFARLFRGDTSGHGGDDSRADYALIGMLRFYTQGDPAQMDRIFRQSGLMRDKWDERHASDGRKYGEITIENALKGPYSVWTPRAGEPRAGRASSAATSDAMSADSEDDDTEAGTEEGRPSQADILVRISERAELFRTPGGVAHARAYVNGHYETWAMGEKGGGFRRWLVHEYHLLYKRAPNPQAIGQAMEVILSRALFDGQEHAVHIRLAEHNGTVYHDLGDVDWRCVAINADGWSIVNNPPVYFRRPRSMAALPTPERGGTLEELRPMIGPQSDAEWMLICAWLVGTFHPKGPYTHLSVNGHAGAGKSTKTRILRTVVDPSEAPTRGDPKDERDLAVAAHNNRILALDNLSYMPPWLSDFLCQLSTGSGRGYRSLYSDDEETIFNARRPAIFNGIEEVATRGDLLDRTISVTLARIAEAERKSEGELDAAFSAAHGRILGALYDAVVCALRNRNRIQVSHLPRMADFALWIVAASPALGWDALQFLSIYAGNRESGVANELDASPVASAIIRFMRDLEEWTGEASDLYEALTPLAGSAVQHTRAWPSGPRALSGTLKRLAPALSSGEGILITHFRESSRTGTHKNGARLITLKRRSPTDDANDDAKSQMMTQTILFASSPDPRPHAGPPMSDVDDVTDDAKSAFSSPSFDKPPREKENGEKRGREREKEERTADGASSSSSATSGLICPRCGGSDIREYSGDLRCYVCDERPIQGPKEG